MGRVGMRQARIAIKVANSLSIVATVLQSEIMLSSIFSLMTRSISEGYIIT